MGMGYARIAGQRRSGIMNKTTRFLLLIGLATLAACADAVGPGPYQAYRPDPGSIPVLAVDTAARRPHIKLQ